MTSTTANNIILNILLTSMALAWLPTPLPRWIPWLGPCISLPFVYLSWRYERAGDDGQEALVLASAVVVETVALLAILAGISYRRRLPAGSPFPYLRPMDRPSFPLIVHDDERTVLHTALKSFRDDLGHEEHRVAAVAAGVLSRMPENEATALELDAADMKITWSALHALLDGTRRDQAAERAHIRALLSRMPSEHDVHAIDLDTELARRD